MRSATTWRETESKVHEPGLWLALLAAGVFVLIGTALFLVDGPEVRSEKALWVFRAIQGAFVLFGGALLCLVLWRFLWPVHVRHAAADVLPDVPREPVIAEGSLVHGRLTHELVETPQAWEFRPSGRLLRNDKRFFLGFSIPFLIGFAGLLTWVFHSQLHVRGWVIPAMLAALVTGLCGGSAFLVIGLFMRHGHWRLASMTMPRDGGDIELDAAVIPLAGDGRPADPLPWVPLGKTGRYRLAIPRGQVAAVQLCPWKVVIGHSHQSTTWAVQGLLVLGPSEAAAYHRLPILLTGDAGKAAQLVQRLAQTLSVPYLFHADAAGWKAEAQRAKSRTPLRSGGFQS